MDHTDAVPLGLFGPEITAALLAVGVVAVFATLATHINRALARRRRVQQWIAQIEAPSPALSEGDATLTGTAIAEGTEPLVELLDSQAGTYRRQKPAGWVWSPLARTVKARPFTLALRGSEVKVRVLADQDTRLDAPSEIHSNEETRRSECTRERHARLHAGESLSVRGRLRRERDLDAEVGYRDASADHWVIAGAIDAPLHLRTRSAAAVIAKTPWQVRGLTILQAVLMPLVLVSAAHLLLLRYGSEVSIGHVGRTYNTASGRRGSADFSPVMDVAFSTRGAGADDHRCTELSTAFEDRSHRRPIAERDLVRIAYLPAVPDVCDVAGPLRVQSFLDFFAMVIAVPFLTLLLLASVSRASKGASCVPWFEREPPDTLD